jgi:hypothetical protein
VHVYQVRLIANMCRRSGWVSARNCS